MKKCSVKKSDKPFKPWKIPRYLPGQVPRDQIKSDLKEYNKHLYNIHTAISYVDCKPPYMNPYNYVNLKKFQLDAKRLLEIDRDNKKLITRINIINRTKGFTDCWNEYSSKIGTNWLAHIAKLKKVMEHNKEIYDRITKTKTNYSRKKYLADWDKALVRIKYSCKYPFDLLTKKSIDQRVREQPSISEGLGIAGPRPKVYMNFGIKNGLDLGQMIIELYSEVAPITIDNFLGICNGHENLTYINCRIHNGVKGHYFETGDITHGNGKGGTTIYGENFNKEPSPLKHSKIGVISAVPLKTDGQNNSQFSITLKPMPEWDGKRAAIGKVIKGNKVLCKINDMCKRAGLPLENIVITKCGQIPYTEEELIVVRAHMEARERSRQQLFIANEAEKGLKGEEQCTPKGGTPKDGPKGGTPKEGVSRGGTPKSGTPKVGTSKSLLQKDASVITKSCLNIVTTVVAPKESCGLVKPCEKKSCKFTKS